MEIGILGGGHGGLCLYSQLKFNKLEPHLWYDKNHGATISPILLHGKINLNIWEHNIQTEIQINNITNDLESIIQHADVIYNCTPVSAHASVFSQVNLIVTRLKKQIVFINLGGSFSCIQLMKISNNNPFITIGSSSTFPYSCRVKENTASIKAIKSYLPLAFVTSHVDTINLTKKLNLYFPTRLQLKSNFFELALSGTNPTIHPIIVLLNFSRIEKEDSFYFYSDGVSPHVDHLLRAVDEERLYIAKVLGLNLLNDYEQDNIFYNTQFTSYYDFAQNSLPHKASVAPNNLKHRYITEDIPFGLVPLWSLGKCLNVDSPNIKALITLFSVLLQKNFLEEGLNFLNEREFVEKLLQRKGGQKSPEANELPQNTL